MFTLLTFQAALHAQVESHLEEMLLLCQRSEEYNQFMLAKMADAVAPAILGTNRENAFRCASRSLCVAVGRLAAQLGGIHTRLPDREAAGSPPQPVTGRPEGGFTCNRQQADRAVT